MRMSNIIAVDSDALSPQSRDDHQSCNRSNAFITETGFDRGSSAYNADMKCADAGADIFNRGLCLPSDIGMTEEEQGKVIEITKRCFSI